MIPTSAHNEQLTGDTLYGISFNYEWRVILYGYIIEGLGAIAATIEDETDLQNFESLYGALIDDLYDEDNVDNMPVGFIEAYPSNTPPTAKWLRCNGQTIAQADYPELYALIGDFYTVPPITDMFKVPNLQTKILRGADTGVNTPGTGGGSDTHTLTTAEMPEHDHTIAHTHTIPIADNGGVQARAGRGTSANIGTLSTSASSASNSGSTGGGGSHNNIPAVIHMAYMIKALP